MKFWRHRKDEELDAEIRSHLDEAIRDRIARGETPDEARADALREFGNVGLVKEVTREMWGWASLERFWQDLRFGLRMLRKHPGFTFAAVLLLALGIGVNTALFSVVDAVLLKRLPVNAPEQLVLLSRNSSGKTIDNFSFGMYERLRDHDRTLTGLLAYYPLRLTASIAGQPEPALNGQLVTGNYYAVLGVNAARGRTLTPEDDRTPGAHPVCVISDGYWHRRFGRDPKVIGQNISLSNQPFTVIGVTPPEFFGTEVGAAMDITVPLTMQEQVIPGIRSFMRGGTRFRLLGRLQTGATMAQAQASLGLLYQQYMADELQRISTSNKGKGPDPKMLAERLQVASGSQGLSALRRQFSQSLFVLMGVVALVLLIACANVAGLMLARAVSRRQEMAVRLALGAARWRLMRQLLTESLLLAGLGGLFGWLSAWWGTRLLLPWLSQGEIPLRLNLTPDLRLLVFTAVAALLTGVWFGFAPAWLATRVELHTALKQDVQAAGKHGGRLGFGQVFVVAQVALSLLLLVGAGLFVRSLQKLQQVDTGFARENVVVLKLEPVGSDGKWNVLPQLTSLYDELLRRTQAFPDVLAASLIGYSPMSRREWLTMGETPDTMATISLPEYTPSSDEEMDVHFMQVYPNSFAALGVPLLAGRDFTPQDNDKQAPPVAIINESLARRFFGNQSPIGRRFSNRLGAVEIIGVVKDVKYRSLREQERPMYYRPFQQPGTSRGQMTLVVRTTGDPLSLAAALQREARALDPAMPLFTAETLAAQLDASLAQERLVAALSSVFSLLALLLACIGLYGVLAYDVARRTHEIGIRMALGASSGRIVQLVLRETLWLMSIGVVIGLGTALAATRWVKSLLFGLEPHDPLTMGLAVLTLLVVAAVAGYLPARRAAKVDPLVALRHE